MAGEGQEGRHHPEGPELSHRTPNATWRQLGPARLRGRAAGAQGGSMRGACEAARCMLKPQRGHPNGVSPGAVVCDTRQVPRRRRLCIFYK